jgi:uncharacterized protein
MEERQWVVAYSGGLDSSLVLWLALQAQGPERVLAAHLDWGIYTYSSVHEQVQSFSRGIGLLPCIIPSQRELEAILRRGPACNRCTRQAKLGRLRAHFPEALILTGANRSDSWGQRGEPLMNGILAPLFALEKTEVRLLAAEAGLKVTSVGESDRREGCKAKHLLKPLVIPDFHGRAVAQANEMLLAFLAERPIRCRLANVKIIGPLSENLAVVNILPALRDDEEETLRVVFQTARLPIHSFFFPHHSLTLTVVANPALTNDAHARAAVEDGILRPGFSVPLNIRWLRSGNKRLGSFHVVEVKE